MEGTSPGGGGGKVWRNFDESHEMRRNGEKLSWDLKMMRSQEKLNFYQNTPNLKVFFKA